MKTTLTCKKDWYMSNRLGFSKGKQYTGNLIKNGTQFNVKNELGKVVSFHKGSDYFPL